MSSSTVIENVTRKPESSYTGGRTMKKRAMKRRTLSSRSKTGIKGRGAFLRGWAKQSPGTHERTLMLRRCGQQCFLGPKKSFPICRRGTCKRSRKGLYSAYVRAREYMKIKGTKKYRLIAKRASNLLQR
jgi:hypothetical protein